MKYFLLITLWISQYSFAQTKPSFIPSPKGSIIVSAGYGAPSLIRSYLKKNTTKTQYNIIGFGPYMFKADYFITDKFSLGASVTYSFSRISWIDDGYDPSIHAMGKFEYGIEMEDISASIRMNYHFSPQKRLDKYVGFGTGYGRIVLGTYTEAPVNQFSVAFSVPRPLSFETTFGLRYMATKRIGIYSEFGIGKSWILLHKYFLPESVIQAGLSYRFL